MKKSTLKQIDKVHLLGVRIDTLSVVDLLDYMTDVILSQQGAIITYIHVHAINLAYQSASFKALLDNADIAFCDGLGVKWGGKILGQDIPHRYTPPDWLPMLCERCVQHDFSLFFIGGRPGVAKKAAATLQAQFPALKIKETHHGYFDKTAGSQENEQVLRLINAAQPDILVVGFGMPTQEQWLMDNWSRLEVHVALTGGAIFDYISGELRRGPRWMTDHGFEWLARLIIEPRRLWKRYLLGNPLFIYRIFKERLKAGSNSKN